MKRIITTAVFLVFSTISANAIDKSSFEVFSLTGGVANSQSVWGASAREKNFNDTNVLTHNKRASGVFTDGYGSQFVELGIGRFISLGYEHTPDSISTPEVVSNEGRATQNKVKVDFNDLDTLYVKLNTPWGLYLKAGTVETDIDIKEVSASGATYNNMSTNGSMVGAGYQKLIGDSGFGFRLEGSYMELDNVTSTNGSGTANNADGTTTGGGINTITAKNLEGLAAKVALTYTFGRNGN